MKRAPRSRQRHDLYAKYHDYDSEISDLLGECGLTMLVATALLCLGIPFIYGLGRFKQPGGVAWAAGNREQALTVPAWTERAVKAHANLIESLAPFAILVLVAHVSARANSATALGAEIFFWGRVAHLAIYVAGIAYLRTLAWFGSWVGGAIILAQIF